MLLIFLKPYLIYFCHLGQKWLNFENKPKLDTELSLSGGIAWPSIIFKRVSSEFVATLILSTHVMLQSWVWAWALVFVSSISIGLFACFAHVRIGFRWKYLKVHCLLIHCLFVNHKNIPNCKTDSNQWRKAKTSES